MTDNKLRILVHPPPTAREWHDLDDKSAKKASDPPAEKFSVMTYNTLCDKFATTSQYGYTPSTALSWEHRKELILQELLAQDSEIICMQEVDMESFNEYFRPKLALYDYKGVFWPKSRANTMAEKEAKLVDGCATFYKGSKSVLMITISGFC